MIHQRPGASLLYFNWEVINSMSLNLVMMATGEFALPSFRELITSPHRVTALITQPDRVNPRGKVHPHPLKEYALAHDIPVLQPESINAESALRTLQALRPDVVAVAAYGQILKAPVLSIPKIGMFNLHASLLPRHRGAAPVQYAIWSGDKRTGVTIFKIEPKLDAGMLLLQRETDILPGETSGELHDRLAELGAAAFEEAMTQLENGTARLSSQDPHQVTLAPKIRKEQGAIDWTQSPQEIDCHIRAMQPWPNPFTYWHTPHQAPERLLILRVEPTAVAGSATSQPGDILQVTPSEVLVQCGGGVLKLILLQRAGRKPMHIGDFLRGTPLQPGEHLGPESTSG